MQARRNTSANHHRQKAQKDTDRRDLWAPLILQGGGVSEHKIYRAVSVFGGCHRLQVLFTSNCILQLHAEVVLLLLSSDRLESTPYTD